jgi:hypothetical protein
LILITKSSQALQHIVWSRRLMESRKWCENDFDTLWQDIELHQLRYLVPSYRGSNSWRRCGSGRTLYDYSMLPSKHVLPTVQTWSKSWSNGVCLTSPPPSSCEYGLKHLGRDCV